MKRNSVSNKLSTLSLKHFALYFFNFHPGFHLYLLILIWTRAELNVSCFSSDCQSIFLWQLVSHYWLIAIYYSVFHLLSAEQFLHSIQATMFINKQHFIHQSDVLFNPIDKWNEYHEGKKLSFQCQRLIHSRCWRLFINCRHKLLLWTWDFFPSWF